MILQIVGRCKQTAFISVIKDLSEYEAMNSFKLKKIAKGKGIEFDKKIKKKELINRKSEVK
ncbi:unnamed protein product [marine sediment metagenome]|uniref:Uncharacterized protein n=1 Tax=marine sediment metagenome TaxID=412755 RepID=X1J8E4_9ZZZZ